jgi:membrane associated rhomboid family serine protease
MKKIVPLLPITIALIAINAAVALTTNLGTSMTALQPLLISSMYHQGLTDIFNGQVWRLITPIFIHFGIMHFVFNMMWVWDLGKLIEMKKGPGFFLLFIMLVGSASNLTQYLLTQSALFGGMSGVVYGLFGYVWIRGRYEPTFNAGLHKTTVNMMLAWFVLCWTGLLGPIANWAHTIGLLTGAVWAYLENSSSISSGSGLRTLTEQQAQQRLAYLSTADVLQMESQREWVREHYQPEARDKYDSVSGKLGILNAILNRASSKPFEPEQQRSVEIAFGDALVQETHVQWAVVEEGKQRTPVLLIQGQEQGTPLTIFPLISFARLRNNGNAINVQKIFDQSVELIRQKLREAA